MSSATAADLSNSDLVLSLGDLRRGDLAVAGGKGANLGELVRGGFPVPPGFVVSTAAYDRFVAKNALQDVIARELARGEGSGSAIRDAFEQGRIPADVERSVLDAYRKLGGPVAVRSSATAEDLPEAAFAGQQDTFLNVIGEEALLDAVRRCWASLWSDRAIAYRERQEVDQAGVKLAVVVQQMVMAESAGVMFTAHPVTGARGEIVIDASPGLGEAVVAGLVTPDHYVLRKGSRGWQVAERSKGRREVAVQPVAGGGTEHVTLAAEANPRPSLSDGAMFRLADLGRDIERHFGSPQDVEWAWAGDKLYIVQARPITALPEPPTNPSKMEQVVARMFSEMVPVRPYPLDMTTWVPALSEAATRPVFGLLGIKPPSVPSMFSEEDGVAVRFAGLPSIHATPAVLLAPLRLVRTALRYGPANWQDDPVRTKALSRVRALEARDHTGLTVKGLLASVRAGLSLLLPLTGVPRQRYLPRVALAALLVRLITILTGRKDRFGTLLFSGVENKTTEANSALEDLAGQISSNSTLAGIFAGHESSELRAALEKEEAGRAFLRDLGVFLDRYGHRETLLIGPSQPTWKDAPEAVLGILKGLAAAPPSRSGPPAWKAARDDVLAHPLMRIRPLREAFLKALDTARYFLQIRENSHFDAMLVLGILRRAMLELGQRLTRAGVLSAPEDVFNLKIGELERLAEQWPPPPALALEMRDLAVRRKEKRAALESTPLVDPRIARGPEPAGGALLSGTPGSPGVAEGPTRIVRGDGEFGKLRPGDVLVAPYTNPAWTPLFQRAAAVVVDSGGAASHAAIVAREYGIPAVMGTVDGTTKLVDGQRVRVDGNRGGVYPAPEEKS
jgi:phosphohistidine swiveling domain-containing protein